MNDERLSSGRSRSSLNELRDSLEPEAVTDLPRSLLERIQDFFGS
jgi:hypothetical protein